MKILLTGHNKNQCTFDYYQQQQLKVVASHYSLIRCLQDMGHTVEQRPVRLGEDLSGYDEVIIYIHSPKAFCQFLWSGLYAVYARQNAILAFDDWQVNQILYSIESYRRYFAEGDLEKAFKDYFFELWQGEEDKATVAKYAKEYEIACETILSKNNRLLISAFAGGDISLLKTGWAADKIYTFNPNPYHLNRTPENNFHSGVSNDLSDILFGGTPKIEKQFKWNFASLVQKKTRAWVEKQGVSEWPIEYYGSKRNEEKCERLTEDQMCRKFQETWGILMPGYFHSGSGWWRARPLQVADVKSILVGDKKELMVYYKDESLIKTAREIEAMDFTQLTKLAQDQHDAIYDVHPLDKKVTQRELEAVLNG